MNYRHIYHAGNFADVVKHCVILEIINALLRKEKGFYYIDTHAGLGLYDLNDMRANKTHEYQQGIQLLLANPLPDPLKEYIEIVKSYNTALQNQIRYYPGSPLVIRPKLREQDRMILNELHPEDFQRLKKYFARDKQIQCHQRDAYEFAPAVLPQPLKRGVVLIDPPYENKNEIWQITEALTKCLKRAGEGVYAIWFPIKDSTYKNNYKILAKAGFTHSLQIEFILSDNLSSGRSLIGCGFVIVNPPYQLEEKLRPLLKTLWKILSVDQQGGVDCRLG